jgi:hypothetical protein
LAQEEKERKARELEQERLLKLQQEAEERERRIQEQMKLTKMRNDAMLGANRTEFANPFFAARQVQKVVSLLGDTVDSSNEPAEQEVRYLFFYLENLSFILFSDFGLFVVFPQYRRYYTISIYGEQQYSFTSPE